MSNITISIEAPALAEAINHLADAITKNADTGHGATMIINRPANPDVQAPAKPEEPVPKPVPTPEPAPVPVPAAPAAPEKKTYTLDDLSMAAAALIDKGKMQDIMRIISGYGVPAINLLRPDQYEAFARDLEAIGGQL